MDENENFFMGGFCYSSQYLLSKSATIMTLCVDYCSAVDTIAKSKSLSRRQKSRESKQYTARIHVADICQAILASMSIRSARFVCLFFIFYFRSSKRLLLFQFFCLQSYFQTSLNLPWYYLVQLSQEQIMRLHCQKRLTLAVYLSTAQNHFHNHFSTKYSGIIKFLCSSNHCFYQ